jgi:hypothetical protein
VRYGKREESAFERMFEIGAVGRLRGQLLTDVRQSTHHVDALEIGVRPDHLDRVERRTVQSGRVGDHSAHRHVDEDVIHAQAVLVVQPERTPPRRTIDLVGRLIAFRDAAFHPLRGHQDHFERPERNIEIHQIPSMLGNGVYDRQSAVGLRPVVGLQTDFLDLGAREIE